MKDPAVGSSAFGGAGAVKALLREIGDEAAKLARPVTFMEVCGTHTHTIGAAGLRTLLPERIRLVSGPGCPVCVTPVGYLDQAEALAEAPDIVLCTFGDLFRVPSSRGSLEQLAARGKDVRIVYSPRDALELARHEPERRVVFLSIGFETTTPTVAAAVQEAETSGTENFLILPGNKTVPEALHALAADPQVALDGLLLPGHVSVVTGADAFGFLPEQYGLPAVVAGFTPTDVLQSVLELVRQQAEGRPALVNRYRRVVSAGGNRRAQALVGEIFEPTDARWRGLGTIPGSGLRLRSHVAARDASALPADVPEPVEPAGCRCGDVLKGLIDPPQCGLFGRGCDPDHPVGACMVSSEGSCAAWFRHERHRLGAGADG